MQLYCLICLKVMLLGIVLTKIYVLSAKQHVDQVQLMSTMG